MVIETIYDIPTPTRITQWGPKTKRMKNLQQLVGRSKKVKYGKNRVTQ